MYTWSILGIFPIFVENILKFQGGGDTEYTDTDIPGNVVWLIFKSE